MTRTYTMTVEIEVEVTGSMGGYNTKQEGVLDGISITYMGDEIRLTKDQREDLEEQLAINLAEDIADAEALGGEGE